MRAFCSRCSRSPWWPVRAPRTRRTRRRANPPQRHRVRSRLQRAGAAATSKIRRLAPSNIVCRRIPRPNKRWRSPDARSPSPPPPVQSTCSTTRASRKPISPTLSYRLDDADARTRPVTFFFNGGPGAASAYLQFGATGPWRLNLNAVTSSVSPELQPNAETWLDFTDLVFIDPVGTGYSRFVATGDDVRKRFFSTEGDVDSIAVTIRRWLEKYDRLLSPKFVAGESYGGIRGPKIVRELQTQQGVGVKGLILVSPLLDFREYSGSSILQYVASLPTMAAVAREAKAAVTRADMADVEDYARGDFLSDLVKGMADA